jgi:murein endopeptidase
MKQERFDSQVTVQLPSPGTGYTSYSPSQNQFGRQVTIDALVDISQSWFNSHSTDPRIQIGDISLNGGGSFPPHQGHQKGLEADLRPMRNDAVEGPTDIKSSTYSQPLTREVVQIIKQHSNLDRILFNDPQLVAEGLVTSFPGHDNHLHVEFKP